MELYMYRNQMAVIKIYAAQVNVCIPYMDVGCANACLCLHAHTNNASHTNMHNTPHHHALTCAN